MFLRKTPMEKLLIELFSRFKHGLSLLEETGIHILEGNRTWKCVPKVCHGIIDFSVAICVCFLEGGWVVEFAGLLASLTHGGHAHPLLKTQKLLKTVSVVC
ncbi:hypothetical protein ANCCAN_04877 [Ancylostoma caninum]|uniref:Uncharacterized protein n=1 Tax=Ancylostoma caninum TaxID=29170 RepID=A0A368H172_ANCCA|nr:hypothetical protein ANCCAN_04877 [Ancylostoma caninum]